MIRVEHLIFCVQLVDKFQGGCIPIHVEFEAHEALPIGRMSCTESSSQSRDESSSSVMKLWSTTTRPSPTSSGVGGSCL